MKELPYWNHNTAYYKWIARRTAGCGSILDVGCGDGSLARYLDDGTGTIVGIDPDEECVRRARQFPCSPSVSFLRCSFEDYAPERLFGAVVFSASLHHMEMEGALRKASDLLSPGGRLLVVGLAKPSSPADRLVEILRVMPSGLLSLLHRMKTTEEAGIPVSYDFPEMRAVRTAAERILPGAQPRYGLHYRYLLEWKKPGAPAPLCERKGGVRE